MVAFKKILLPACPAATLLIGLLAGCGGGSTGSSTVQSTSAVATATTAVITTTTSVTTATTTTAPQLAALINAHGMYADAKGVFPTDAEAGIFPNPTGFARSFSTAGKIDVNGPFFKPFGNGRSCASCHVQADGFSVTTKGLQERFAATNGNDPVFQLIDGANSPLAAVGTLDEKRAAYSMLLNRGVFRISLKVPATAEFDVIKVDDPYHFATANELSLYRRPLPSANLKFLADVMWDGRETGVDSTSLDCFPTKPNPIFFRICYASLDANLGRQANNANKGHAQAQEDLSQDDINAIVSFEKTLFVAQQVDQDAGLLFSADGSGGALALSKFDFTFGVNDFIDAFFTKADFTPDAFTLYPTWLDIAPQDAQAIEARKAIARGQIVFNEKKFFVKNLPGISDIFGNNFFVNCSTCHSIPNVGNLSMPQSFDIGLTQANIRTPDMPLYTLKNKVTGEVITTTDPGRAMTTGLWKDISRFKPPVLRGLALRAPYFHDGSAKTIEEVTKFYNTRFGSVMTDQEILDLNAFLKSL